MGSLTLYDFRDIDLMLKVAREADAEGISSSDLADLLGMEDDTRPVGSRLAWMRRYGFFDFDDEKRLWRLSHSGDRIVESHVRASTLAALEKVPDESMVEVMAHVTSRYRHADHVTATLLRREFLFGTKPNSAAYNQRRRRSAA